MKLTEEQSAAISSRGRVIVSASAGSGKTFVMINRLVELILGGQTDVRHILALTFTNKAASQMREKLRSALIARISETEGDALARLKNQLKELPLAEIGTIHAFCGRTVRSHFFLVGLDPAFRIISPDDAEGNALSSKALDEVFENAYERGGEAFGDLLAVYFRKKKDVRLKKLVLSLYRAVCGSGEGESALARVGKEDFFERGCKILYDDFRARIRLLLRTEEELSRALAGSKPKAVAVCAGILDRCESLIGASDLFEMAERARVPFKIPPVPAKTKSEGEELRLLEKLAACSKGVKELNAELSEISAREEEHARCENARVRAGALAALAAEYGETYARLKREANVLDYDDLERFALRVLSDPAVQKEAREKYRYVFVDEYQDVNPVQESILSLVAGEEVFLVGDSKQAIYGFRGSKSVYFTNKERELEQSLKLTSNFRSASGVLEAVNRVFPRLIPDYPPMRGGTLYGDYEGAVRFHVVREEEKEKAERGVYSVLASAGREETDALAEEVARLVEEECGSLYYDIGEEREEDRVKPVTYGDIAVLARKNSGDAERIVRALARRGIPVSASSKTNVCDCFEARLLIDWLSYLDNAEQDLPLATALLSQIGGLDDGELCKIRARFPSPYTFREACGKYAEKMADALSQKLRSFAEKTEELRTMSAVSTAAEVMGKLLADGLEVQIAAKQGGKERLARVRRLCAEAETCGSVHDFLTRLKNSDYRVEYAESGGEGAVKVLTMHASKGLEYPVVILASLDTLFHGADKDELMYTDELLVSPRCYDAEEKLVSETLLRKASAVLQREEERKQECNLLYVAMTRARCRLHMMFGEREHALSPESAKRFSDMIDFAACSDYFAEEPACERGVAARAAYVGRERERADAALLRRAYEADYPYEESFSLPVKSSATELLHEEAPLPFDGEEASGGYTVEQGLAYHAFLERVAFGAPVQGELERMRQGAILSEEQLSLLDPEKLEKILSLPCFERLAGGTVLREQKFLVRLPAREIYGGGAEDEVLFQGAIDLLACTREGYLILDYKYSAHGDGYLKERYGRQIALYKKAVARVLGVDEKQIAARIVNVARLREIAL